jgi:PAS domain S-box-containing protein
MTITRKTLITLGLAFICLIGSYYAFSRTVLQQDFDDLEGYFSAQYAAQAVDYVTDETRRLASLNQNWATWDALYAFMADADAFPDFIPGNITPEALSGLRINFLLLWDADGNLVHLSGVDLATGQPMTLTDGTVNAGDFKATLLPLTQAGTGASGLIQFDGTPAMFALNPVLTSDGDGPARGSLVFGRFLDQTEAEALSELLQVGAAFYSVPDADVPGALQTGITQSGSPSTTHTEPLDNAYIASYRVLDDVSGEALLVIRTAMPRQIYQQARNSFSYTTLIFIVIGLVVVGLALWFLERNILSRVSHLTRDVGVIGSSGKLSTRVRASGRDEISQLAHNINDMMQNLESLNREKTQAQSALNESETQFRSVTDTANDAIITVDIRGRINYLNQAARRVFGLDGSESPEMSFYELFPRTEHARLNQLVNDALESEDATGDQVLRHEIEAQRKSGDRFPSETSVASWRTDQRHFVTAIIRDITERQRTQQDMEQRNLELQQANAAKSDFMAQMSHELRTPLNAILGFSELMADKIMGELNEEQTRSIHDIYSSGQHLLNLIDDVLDISKVEAGKVTLEPVDLSISEAVNEAVREIRPVSGAANQKITLNISPETPSITADKKMLRQVLLNLFSNASKFSPPGSEINLSSDCQEDFCRIRVSDHGIGIKPDQLKKVFDPFYQAETLTDKAKEGTGLGLNICKQYITLMGGQIWAESTYGEGSTFTFTLPSTKPI